MYVFSRSIGKETLNNAIKQIHNGTFLDGLFRNLPEKDCLEQANLLQLVNMVNMKYIDHLFACLIKEFFKMMPIKLYNLMNIDENKAETIESYKHTNNGLTKVFQDLNMTSLYNSSATGAIAQQNQKSSPEALFYWLLDLMAQVVMIPENMMTPYAISVSVVPSLIDLPTPDAGNTMETQTNEIQETFNRFTSVVLEAHIGAVYPDFTPRT